METKKPKSPPEEPKLPIYQKEITMDIIDLTSQIIAIQSYVDGDKNESKLGQFCFDYIKNNSQLKVKKQKVTEDRFNIIASNSDQIDTLIIGHIDTVQPSSSWTKDPFKPEIVGDKLFGLGSTDMKSGVALMLDLTTNPSLKPNTMFLFYIDEEYDFLGMKKFIKDFKNKIKPKQIISLDGSDLSLNLSCRGLIEIRCTIKGLSGHAARSQSCINAIYKSFQLIDKLFNWLDDFKSSELGNTSFNLAYITGGQPQGNIIPDFCQFIVDIRPASPKLNGQKIIKFLKNESKKLNISLTDFSIRHDLGSWITPKDSIDLNFLPENIKNPSDLGYIDVQMLWQNFDQVPCFSIGAGDQNMAHKSDEFLNIKNLFKLQKILSRVLITS